MFYQEELPICYLLSRVQYGCLLMRDVYFCMGAYNRDVVVLIKIGAYIHRVHILCGYRVNNKLGYYVLQCISYIPSADFRI